jgi:hypothetical protein
VLLISVTYGNVDLPNCLRNVIALFYHLRKEIGWRENAGRNVGFGTLRYSKPVVAIGPDRPLIENEFLDELLGKIDCTQNLGMKFITIAAQHEQSSTAAKVCQSAQSKDALLNSSSRNHSQIQWRRGRSCCTRQSHRELPSKTNCSKN